MINGVMTELNRGIDRALVWFTGGLRGGWGASFLRIILGVTLLAQLLVNFPFRSYLWGPASAWGQELEPNSQFPFQRALFGPTSDLTVMTVAYVVLCIAAVCFLLGWHTRLATAVVLVLHTLMTFSDGVYMDQSDNFLRFALIYSLFMRTWAHWSLDARRLAKVSADSQHPAQRLRNRIEPYVVIVHNAALTAFGAHICMIYVASAMFKIQGEKWQHGTAVFYPLQIPHFAPFPALSDLATAHGFSVTVASYAAVYFQLFFPFMLLNKWLRKVALLGIVGMHLGIAVLMGLPFFSFFMLAGDSIFVSSKTYQQVDRWVRARFGRRLDKRQRGSAHSGDQGLRDDPAAQAQEQELDPEPQRPLSVGK